MMLLSVRDALSDAFNDRGDVRIALSIAIGTHKERERFGLKTVAWFMFGRRGYLRHAIRLLDLAASTIPLSLRMRIGFYRIRDVDVILDASGFALGDQWGTTLAERTATNFEAWARQGKRIILLPQALGPFTDTELRHQMRRIIAAADRIYARDEQSFAHLRELDPSASNILLAPDFTNLLQPVTTESATEYAGAAAIVPNMKMLTATSTNIAQHYRDFLVHAAHKIYSHNVVPIILVHEDNDLELAVSVQAELKDRFNIHVPVVTEPDSQQLKGIIGQCSFVVASRFHAIVSALSQSVPAIATGWSHKYTYLMREYGLPGFLVSPSPADREQFDSLVSQLCSPSLRKEVSTELSAISAQLQGKSVQMWEDIFDELSNSNKFSAPSGEH